MKNILLIGIGGTGNAAVDLLYRKIEKLGNRTNNKIMALLFNMDTGNVIEVPGAQTICMTDEVSVGKVCDRIGSDQLEDWFPWDDEEVRSQSMTFGTSLWRKKAYLAFLNIMYKRESRFVFHRALERMANSEPGSTHEIYVISSIAGATGSGTFIPIALYAKRYIKQHIGISPSVSAMIACPDIYADHLVPENLDKAFANAYAAMRELNAINQVARSGCNRINKLKKTTVNFRLGSERDPIVGVLFDSTDKRYWRPDAAPFDKVYVLDRIPGVHSIEEHYVVLADSLYTLMCTNVGSSVDAEASNHATLISQNNGGSAIFASISTSRIKFPTETLLDFLATERTLRICKSQWLTLHDATNKKIEEKRQRAIENQVAFTLSEAEYAEILLETYDEFVESDSGVVELVNRWTEVRLGESETDNVANLYYDDLIRMIAERATKSKEQVAKFEDLTIKEFEDEDDEARSYKILRNKKNMDAGRVIRAAKKMDEMLLSYYEECLHATRNRTAGISDAILPFDEHKNPRGHKDLSLTERLLIKDGMFMHPVAAMVQLCRVRRRIDADLKKFNQEVRLIPFGNEKKVPEVFFATGIENATGLKLRRSVYYRFGEELPGEEKHARFARFRDRFDDYLQAKRSEEELDFDVMRQDAIETVEYITGIAARELRFQVLKRLAARVDCMIKHYRRFFERFSEVETDALSDMENLKQCDSGRVGSIINVYSSPKQKMHILNDVIGTGDADRLEDMLRADDIAGSGVYDIALQSVREEREDSGHYRDDRNIIRRLLDTMNADNRAVLEHNSEFRRLSSISVMEALEEACGRRTEDSATFRASLKSAMESVFISAIEMATPSLIIEEAVADDPSFITPSEIWRVLISHNTARHIKKNADIYAIPLPDDFGETETLLVCAEEFVKKYIHPRARVSVVPDMPDNVMYITGEMMDITPVRIAKINEMGRTPGYYSHYCRLLTRQRELGTDLLNPHLGFNCYKRAILPYINDEMELNYDSRAIKALLYGFLTDQIRYQSRADRDRSFFVFADSKKESKKPVACTWDDEVIGEANISYLLAWMRDDEMRVDTWSRELDELLMRESKRLPIAVTDEETRRLNSAVSRLRYIKMLSDGICLAERSARSSEKNAAERVFGVFEFADMIKRSEETRRDHNDAEKFLRVTFELFEGICLTAAPTRANLDVTIGLYISQLKSIYSSYERAMHRKYESSDGEKNSSTASEYIARILEWVSTTDTFGIIDSLHPMTDDGDLQYNRLDDPREWKKQFDSFGI